MANFALNAAGDEALTSAFDDGYAQGRRDALKEVQTMLGEHLAEVQEQLRQRAISAEDDES